MAIYERLRIEWGTSKKGAQWNLKIIMKHQARHRTPFGFVSLLVPLMLAMLGLTALYILATALPEKYFYSNVANANGWIGSGKRYGG
jgi:hypothetical protein